MNGQLRDAHEWAGAHKVFAAVCEDEPPGEFKFPVKPRVQQWAAIYFNTHLQPPGCPDCRLRFQFETGESV